MITTQKQESPAATGLPTPNQTHNAIITESHRNEKRYRTVQALAALLGYQLQRTHVEHDPRESYWLSRCGRVLEFRALDDVSDLLRIVGGAL